MVRLGVYATLIWSCFSVLGQVHHSCPMHLSGQLSYVNPLNEQWLSAYDVKYYSIELAASNTDTEISGRAAIGVSAIRDMDTIVFELQDALSVSGVYVMDGISDAGFTEQLSFDHRDDVIFIGLDRTRLNGEEFSIQIQYGGKAGQNRGFFSGISNARDPDYGFRVTYTLSEPHNAKDWFPVKQVLEDKIDSVKVKINCSTELSVASNGLLMGIQNADDNTHTYTWITRYPISYYLISFAVADYRDFSFNAGLSQTGDSVLVQNYIYNSEAVLDDWEEGILATGDMLTLFSRLFSDYPFAKEKYGHAMAPMGGGMEHQTMTTIQDFGFSLVAHELAHQWFGDYITCGNWQDIWINEGFASYMEYVAYEHLVGKEAANQWMTQAMSLALGETSGSVFVPENRVDDTFRLFDYGLTYKKGAILLHMIRYWLDNDELFFDILRSYLEQFGHGLATGEDFRQILESESGIDFSCFFEQWYYGEGYPRFSVHWAQEGDSLRVHVEQSGSTASITPFFETPFDLEIRFYNETPSMVRLTQDQAVKDFSIAVNGVVNDILFDPANHILNSDHVIQQIPSEKRFVFGPNPVSEELFIRFSNVSFIKEIRLTSLTGQEILRQENIENPVKMNLSALKDGTYLLMLYDKDNTYKEHIVKISN